MELASVVLIADGNIVTNGISRATWAARPGVSGRDAMTVAILLPFCGRRALARVLQPCLNDRAVSAITAPAVTAPQLLGSREAPGPAPMSWRLFPIRRVGLRRQGYAGALRGALGKRIQERQHGGIAAAVHLALKIVHRVGEVRG